jgi:hypothetical protein
MLTRLLSLDQLRYKIALHKNQPKIITSHRSENWLPGLLPSQT